MCALSFGGRLLTSLAVIGLLVGCQGGASASPSASPAVVRYEDPVGDQEGGVGPDIVGVTVDQADPSTVRFTVEFAVAPPLGVDVAAGSTDTLMVFMGTRPDFMTTRTDVFAMGLHGATLQDEVANGSHLSVTKGGRGELRERAVKVAVDGASATMTLTREVLGNPATLYFLVGAGREGPGEQSSGGDLSPETEAGEYAFITG